MMLLLCISQIIINTCQPAPSHAFCQIPSIDHIMKPCRDLNQNKKLSSVDFSTPSMILIYIMCMVPGGHFRKQYLDRELYITFLYEAA